MYHRLLCRVFYGGFLQNQILAFLDFQFPTESNVSRSVIIQKLLLSIRTQAVQSKILDFFNAHFLSFSQDLKLLFYNTFLEMLPVCDSLSVALLESMERFLQSDDGLLSARVDADLMALLEADYRKKDHLLMPLLMRHAPFARPLVIRLAFGPWQNRKIREELVLLLSALPLDRITDTLAEAFSLVPDLDQNRLLSDARSLLDPAIRMDGLFDWIAAADRMEKLPPLFREPLFDQIILPAVCSAVCDVFEPAAGPDKLQILMDFARIHTEVSRCPQFRAVALFSNLIKAASVPDFNAVAAALDPLAEMDAVLTSRIAGCIDNFLPKSGDLDPSVSLTFAVLRECLAARSVPLLKLYRNFFRKDDPRATMEFLLSVWVPLADRSSSALAAFQSPDAAPAALCDAFAADCKKGAAHWLKAQIPPNARIAPILLDAASSAKSGNSFLARFLPFLK